MENTSFRTRLRAKQTLIGPLLTLGAPEIAELFALLGFDWAWLDLEHAPLSLQQIQTSVQATGGRMGTAVRVPSNDPVPIKRALDLGCDAIIVPQVNSADEARRAIAAAKYPPQGIRSVGIARAQQYGLNLSKYVVEANDRVAVIVQIEHIDAISHLADILRTPELDAVLVGPYDLSASMGIPGQINNPDVVRVVDSIAAECRKYEVTLGAFCPTVESAKSFQAKGATLIALGTDTMHLANAAKTALGQLREK